MHKSMDLLDVDGKVIGKCEIIDQTESTIFCRNVVIEKALTTNELRSQEFKFTFYGKTWTMVNIPVMFTPENKKTVVACHSDSGAIEFKIKC